MNYESAEQINELFTSSKMTGLPETIYVAGVEYFIRGSISYKITEMLEHNYKNFVVYGVQGGPKDNEEYAKAKEQGLLDEWIVLIWMINKVLSIVPARAVATTKARATPQLTAGGGSLSEGKHNVIADTVDIEFPRFGKNIKAKTDTGANMSSLHVDEWKFLPSSDGNRRRVQFLSKMLSDNYIQVDSSDTVVIKTAEGSEHRPVIELDVKVAGKHIKGAKFNLNDRSHMEDPILLGQNILEKGNFLVDPNIEKHIKEEQEEIDWNILQERFLDISFPEE